MTAFRYVRRGDPQNIPQMFGKGRIEKTDTRTIVERTVSLDDIQSLSDRWIIPFAIAISSENHEIQHTLMCRLTSSDPGLASLVMEGTEDDWQHGVSGGRKLHICGGRKWHTRRPRPVPKLGPFEIDHKSAA